MKKALTTLAVASALTMAASANAAMVNFNMTDQQYGADWATATTNYTGTGTGTLDTSTGIYNFSLNVAWLNQFFHTGPGEPNNALKLPTDAFWSWSGTIHTGAAPSGTYTTTACHVTTDATHYAAPICASPVLTVGLTQNLEGPPGFPFFSGTPGNFTPVDPLNFSTTPGVSTQFAAFNVLGNRIERFTVTPAAVPVPAAVWLFGSGLAGLAGVARKRRA